MNETVLKKYSPGQSPGKGGTLADIIFGLGVLFLTVVLVVIVLKFSKYKLFYALLVTLFSVGGIIFFLFAFRLKAKAKNNIVFILFNIMVGLWTLEATLPIRPLIVLPGNRPIFVDGKFPKLTDRRSRLEVVQDLRKKNITAYPAIEPSNFFGEPSEALRAGDKVLFPLTGISDSKILFDNESGEWQYFISDEHGFNNPKGLYVPGQVDIVLLGDSYAEGMGVKQNENFAGILREKYSRTLTLGVKGTGPLSQFAIFREYAEPLKPKVVVWFYYESDMGDLPWELQQPQLTAYLDPEYRQNLFDYQPELDQKLKVWLKQKELSFATEKKDSLSWKEWGERIQMTLQLKRMRAFLAYRIRKQDTVIAHPVLSHLWPPDEPNGDYLSLLDFVNKRVQSWGGKLYVAAIPTTLRVREGAWNPKYNYSLYRNGQLAGIEKLNIPLIDLYPVLLSHPDPMSLYRFRRWGHYNEKGYRFVGEAIIKHLTGV